MPFHETSVRARVLAVTNLEPLPEVLIRMCAVSEDPKCGAGELAEVVGFDPGLAAEVLRAVNGAAYGLRQSVDSLRDAITLLGLRTVRNLAVTLLVRGGLLPRGRAPHRFDRVGFWRHCVSTAIHAEGIAKRVGIPKPSAVYAAGLLHDVGIIVLDQCAPEELGGLVELVARGQPLVAVEQGILGCSHTDIGRFVGETWRLPPNLVEGIAYHHDPLTADPACQPLTCAVHLADVLASPRTPSVYAGGPPEQESRVLRFFGISPEVLTPLHAEAEAAMQRATQLLNLESGEPAAHRKAG